MSLTALSGIFGVTPTVANGDITIPSGSITSYIPLSNTSPPASEFVFGMCETMHQAVSVGGLTNCTSTVQTSLSGSTLRKVYTFSINLDFSGTDLDLLNVKSESE